MQGELDPIDSQGHHLFHVVVQSEEFFRGILEAFIALDAKAVTVLEGRAPRTYLQRQPLFAGLLDSDENRFCRIIIAALDRRLSNEAIRRVQEVTGDLRLCSKVHFSVQEVFWAAGALDW